MTNDKIVDALKAITDVTIMYKFKAVVELCIETLKNKLLQDQNSVKISQLKSDIGV